MDINTKYQFTTERESVIEKDWAAGSAKPISQIGYYASIVDGKIIVSHRVEVFAPAWLKIIDEPIVNALDQIVKTSLVKNINIDFHDGTVSIYNDGPGLDVVVHPEATAQLGETTYVPTILFGKLFQGSNRVKENGSIVGGTNGIGAKLPNCFSSKYVVESVDAERKLHYTQTWRDNMTIRDEPIITTSTSTPFTKLSFTPDVKIFGDTSKLGNIVLTRVLYASAYANLCSRDIIVRYNGMVIPIKSIADIAKLIYEVPPIVMTHVDTYSYVISCTCVKTKMPAQLSTVNGVVAREGSHFTKVKALIATAVKARLSKTFNSSDFSLTPSFITDNMFIMIAAQIPGALWDGQRKDTLSTDIRNINITLDNKFTNAIAVAIEEIIKQGVLNKKKRKKVIEYKKYIEPNRFTPKPMLVLCEGDSALDQVKNAILANEGLDHYGLFSTGGVIMNARKKCKLTMDKSGRKIVKPSESLKKNIELNALFDILGLNTSYNYDSNSKTYKTEYAELRYAGILACLDQDLDGKGNILGLIINIFNFYWPHLVDSGFVKWYATPIINAYPRAGGQVISFQSEAAFAAANLDTKKYDVQYYKGLGTHSPESIKPCFRNMSQNIYTLYNDSESLALCEAYYGISSLPRKVELSKPLITQPSELTMEQESSRLISISDHLRYETFTYCKDNLERKLDSCIDGQNQAGRKILNAALRKFSRSNERIRVAQFAGHVSESENYHHGEESLCNSITGRAFVAIGGKQLPLLIPLSAFGSRLCGGERAASPRYIYTKLNSRLTDLLFPSVDYQILTFNFVEGKRCEPKYFLPIVPLAICESTELPAHGWKLKTWARSVYDCIDATLHLIDGGTGVKQLKLCTYSGKWTGTTRYIRGKLHSMGTYTFDGNITITIVELPLRTWNNNYIADLKKRDAANQYIKKIQDKTMDEKVNIVITLRPGAIDKISELGDLCYTDGIEEYFMLRCNMSEELNMLMPDYAVREFASYGEILLEWYKERKFGYELRVARTLILKDATIEMLTNQCKYAKSGTIMNKLTDAEQTSLLRDAGYATFNESAIIKPKFTPNDQLHEYVRNGGYDYLLNMTDKNKSVEAINKYETRLAALVNERAVFAQKALAGKFIGAEIWRDELNAIKKVIQVGEHTSWKFGDHNKYTY